MPNARSQNRLLGALVGPAETARNTLVCFERKRCSLVESHQGNGKSTKKQPGRREAPQPFIFYFSRSEAEETQLFQVVEVTQSLVADVILAK